MAAKHFWSDNDIRVSAAILAECTSMDEALDRISVALGRIVSRASIDRKFEDMGQPTPYSMLRREKYQRARSVQLPAPIPPPPPSASAMVEEREERDRAKRARGRIDSLVQELREARARQAFLDAEESSRTPPRLRRGARATEGRWQWRRR